MLLNLLFFFGCQPEFKDEDKEQDEGVVLTDNDGDGFFSDEDCNDEDPLIHPDAIEICDGFDNNCNNQFDEEVLIDFYADSDGDGYGSASITTQACSQPSGYVDVSNDCDDTLANTYPGAEEICDGIDNDCNSEIDEGLGSTYYTDSDGDGFGDENQPVEKCSIEDGLAVISGDCDDSSSNINPMAEEVCDEIDNNCNDEIDEGVTKIFYLDEDEDGYGNPDEMVEGCLIPEGYVDRADDCDDLETLANPNRFELCDEIDNNCDGFIDENTAINTQTYFADEDEDGFGDPSNTTDACSLPEGFVQNNTDCDDNTNAIHPNAEELCNGIDENCNAEIDEGAASDGTVFFADEDEDGFGDPNVTWSGCAVKIGYVENSDDCNDNNEAIYPEAQEFCNEQDDDCDEEIDEAGSVGEETWYADEDDDGFGDDNNATVACFSLDGFVEISGDCADDNADINPTATETCETEEDDNCNGSNNEPTAIGSLTFYRDADEDGFGNNNDMAFGCAISDGYVEDNTDCDDDRLESNPNALEYCNGINDDCDEETDESDAEDALTFYRDADEDTFGDNENSMVGCSILDGYVEDNTDCDDDRLESNPNALEFCNGINDDCDEETDESDAEDTLTFYRDADEDTFGNINDQELACTAPDGYVEDNTDCDDDRLESNPDAKEFCNNINDDCDEEIDESDAEDALDYYKDADGDGFGDDAITVRSCNLPDATYVLSGGDCNDDLGSVNPDQSESCFNGTNDDCDDSTEDFCENQSSCKSILEENPSAPTGPYLIVVGDSLDDVYPTYCDMDTDGGGWTLAVKAADSTYNNVNEVNIEGLDDDPNDASLIATAKMPDTVVQALTTESWRLQGVRPGSHPISTNSSRYFSTGCLFSTDSSTSSGGQCLTSCSNIGMTSDCYTGDSYRSYGIRNYCCTTYYSNYRSLMYDGNAYMRIPSVGDFNVSNETDLILVWVR